MNISVSLLNDFDKIAMDDFCGWYFWKYYVLKEVTESKTSEAMKLGQYFEYASTGAKLRNGSIPQPKMTKGSKNKQPEPTADYKRVDPHVSHWNNFVKKMNIQIVNTGEVLTSEYKGLMLKGILDVNAMIADKPVIIDLKYTGQINNKWDHYGWGHADISGIWQKMLQPIMYCYLYEVKNGVRPDFYFYVASSTDEKRRIFKINVSDSAIERMLGQSVYTNEMIQYNNSVGWIPTQNYLNCMDCPLKDTCEHCITIPEIKNVTV